MSTQTTSAMPTTMTRPEPALRAAMPSAFRDPFLDLRNRIDRVFDGFFGGDLLRATWPGRDETMPKVDVAETEKALTITADLPGVDEKDVELTVADGVLTLKGEKTAGTERTEADYHMMERSYGAFARSFRLPDTVKMDEITAAFDKGVLTVTLPKGEAPKPEVKHIPVGNGTT